MTLMVMKSDVDGQGVQIGSVLACAMHFLMQFWIR